MSQMYRTCIRQPVSSKQSFPEVSSEVLVGLAREGNQTAVLELVSRFTPLVMSTARRYSSVSYEDAIQEGFGVILSCIQTYDSIKGVLFAGYVAKKVRGDVRTAMRRIWQYEERIADTSRRTSGGGLGGANGSGNESDIDLATFHQGPSAGTAFGVRGMNSGDNGHHDTGYQEAELRMYLKQVGLSPREQYSILVHLEGLTLAKMASVCGVSQDTVKTWRKRALRKLKQALLEF